MTGEPYLVLRDFRVWFGKRRGFLASLRKAEPEYVRAVDGIDLDIRKGEVYCLVGESGCGKTTTGKAILRLVPPTGGDVLLNPPTEVLREYEAGRETGRAEALERIRQRWSLSYAEKVVWKPKDALRFLALALAAMAAGTGVALGLFLAFTAAGLGEWELLAHLLAGTAVAVVGGLPLLPASRRIPALLLPFAFGASLLGRLLGMAVLSGGIGAAASAYAALWGTNFAQVVGLLMEPLFAMLAAGYAAKFSLAYWRSRRGEGDKLRKLRKSLQIIFQDPYESLNPKRSVYDTIAEPLIVNGLTGSRVETEARVERALDDAGLRHARDFLFRYPHELSGGQRQRVSIAGALVLEPDFIVADEPVSMLDVSIRTEILETLLQLRKDKGLTYLFITHDLSLAWVLSDRIAVMYLGKIVEEGPKREVVKSPRHPYTKALISVVPAPDPDRRHGRTILKGERPDPSDIPPGCRFHPRCPVAIGSCGWTAEETREELLKIAASAPEIAGELQGLAVEGPAKLMLTGASDRAEAWVRETVASQAETWRSLQAVQHIERSNGSLRLAIEGGREPILKSVAPDVRVACHLAG